MKIFITGSSTGLGLLAGKKLIEMGFDVLLHARNKNSAQEAMDTLKKDVSFVIGDLSNLEEMKSIAEQANSFGPFKSIIHNAGVYERQSDILTKDGLRTMFAVNVLAPYVLSCLITRRERMVFLSSSMHRDGHFTPQDFQWKSRDWDNTQAYCDSKLYDLMLTKWFANQWPQSSVNAVDPGWVPTRMGGASAPDNLDKGAETQVWLSTSDDPKALVSGKYFHHCEERKSNTQADIYENLSS